MSVNSILAGVDEIIDEALGIKDIGQAPNWQNETSDTRLNGSSLQQNPDWSRLVNEIYSKAAENCSSSDASQSKENWRFAKQGEISPDNKSPEKKLEKAIVNAKDLANWVNQVPVASGLVKGQDTKRALDLVENLDSGRYRFYELKANRSGGTPLHATIELLEYCVLYILYRALKFGADQELLKAREITAAVLAPAEYYGRDFNLGRWKHPIGDALNQLAAAKGIADLKFHFSFMRFDDSCTPDRIEGELTEETIKKWVEGIQEV